MRKLPTPNLSDEDIEKIEILQSRVDGAGDYESRVKKAKKDFKSKPTKLFERVREALKASCGDLVRCGYCEDSCADEVEHVWPKTFFPNHTFDHKNYLFSCGVCNRAKGNFFSIEANGSWLNLNEQRKECGYIEPDGGLSRFVNPLSENPFEYFWLDILGGTFHYVELADEGSREHDRAYFTITTLRLNAEVLVKARANAYQGFLDRIENYVRRKEANADKNDLNSRLFELRRAPHQSVRFEMGRQLKFVENNFPKGFLDKCPEVFEDD